MGEIQRALVVEDDPIVSDYLTTILTDLGFEARSVQTVSAALDAVTGAGPFAVAFVDLGLPDRSGLELLAELGQLQPDLPVIIQTGYGMMIENDANSSPAQPPVCLAKPYSGLMVEYSLAKAGVAINPR